MKFEGFIKLSRREISESLENYVKELEDIMPSTCNKEKEDGDMLKTDNSFQNKKGQSENP